MERLCRYLTRPPLAVERLSFHGDGRLRYTFRRPWRDGTTAIVLEPDTLIERLAALIPRPGIHLLTYHGILAPAASYRDLVVPQPDEDENGDREPAAHIAGPRATVPSFPAGSRADRGLSGPSSCAGCSGIRFFAAPAVAAATS